MPPYMPGEAPSTTFANSDEQRALRQYLLGCRRLGCAAQEDAEFLKTYREFVQHAQRLKQAENENTIDALNAEERSMMQQRFQKDAAIQAMLIGMAEEQQEEDASGSAQN